MKVREKSDSKGIHDSIMVVASAVDKRTRLGYAFALGQPDLRHVEPHWSLARMWDDSESAWILSPYSNAPTA